MNNDKGVSLIICTYNGAKLLPATISFILKQEFPEPIPWEVIFIDNASSDNTVKVIEGNWEGPIHMRIVHEPEPGLVHARQRGIAEARYEYLSFIDDDNWIDPDWISQVYRFFEMHDRAGICGGKNTAVFETDPPAWFSEIQGNFAVGRQGEITSDITDSRGYVWGAGMSLRKSVMETILAGGFKSALTGRKGKELLAGEDTELAFAFRLAGWQIWYCQELGLQHYIPESRFSWPYLIRLYRGFGKSRALFAAYRAAIKGRDYNPLRNIIHSANQLWPLFTWKCVGASSAREGNIKELKYEMHKTKFLGAIQYFNLSRRIFARSMELKKSFHS